MIQFPNFGMNIQIPSPIERVIDGFTALIGVSFVFFPTRLLETKLGNRWCQHLFAFNHLECSTTWIIYALRLQRSMDTYGMFVFGHQLEAEASAMSGFVFVFRSIKEF